LSKRQVFDREAALKERQADPLYVSPFSQPVGTEVELTLQKCPQSPQVVLRDTRRDLTWRVAMVQADLDTWTARVMLPSVPTVVEYHFEFGDGKTFYALRQVETLIPGTPDPIYGEWIRQPFQIAAYDPAQVPPAWTQAQTIYQIFPDRFAKGELVSGIRPHMAQNVHGRERLQLAWDALPEVPPKGRDFYGGNLRGIIDKLDYIRDLGVDCIYLTPIFESPSNHRYDAMDYRAIDPVLGTEADLRELVEQVHQRGMTVNTSICPAGMVRTKARSSRSSRRTTVCLNSLNGLRSTPVGWACIQCRSGSNARNMKPISSAKAAFPTTGWAQAWMAGARMSRPG
jgi:hypothetical protein